MRSHGWLLCRCHCMHEILPRWYCQYTSVAGVNNCTNAYEVPTTFECFLQCRTIKRSVCVRCACAVQMKNNDVIINLIIDIRKFYTEGVTYEKRRNVQIRRLTSLYSLESAKVRWTLYYKASQTCITRTAFCLDVEKSAFVFHCMQQFINLMINRID